GASRHLGRHARDPAHSRDLTACQIFSDRLSGLRLSLRATMRARRSVMYERERRQYEMLVRVRDFGDRYGHLFPASSVAQRNFAAVARAVRELESQDVEHMGASASARAQRKIMAGEALHARLQAIH